WIYSEYGNNFVKTMLNLAEIKNKISVVNDQIGSPTYAIDLAEFVISLILSSEKDYGFYHYSNKGEISWYDFANGIFKEFQKNIEITPISSQDYPTKADRPEYSKLCTDKLEITKGIKIKEWETSL